MEKDILDMFDLETYRTLLAYNGDILLEWNLKTDRFFVTPNWFDIFGYMPSSYNFSQSAKYSDKIHPEDRHLLKEYIDTVYHNKHDFSNRKFFSKVEVRLQNSYHEYVWCKISLATSFSSQNLPYKISGMISDIDFDKKHCESLLNQAQKDLLTGLYNKITTHKLIEESFQSACKSAKHALMIIDIDGFKAINDNFGHLFGDAVISDLAATIKGKFRDSDIVGRVGGDEFIVLLQNITEPAFLHQKAQALLDSLRRSYPTDYTEYKVSGSIGIAIYPTHGRVFHDLYKIADQALYYAKASGKDKYVLYYENMPNLEYKSSRANKDLPAAEEHVAKTRKSFHDNLPEYIFKLLYNSKENTATIHMILELLGKRLNVSHCIIYELNPDKTQYTITAQWCNQNIQPVQHVLKSFSVKEIDDFHAQYRQNTLLKCNDVNTLHEEYRKALKKDNIQAFLNNRFTDDQMPNAFIGFDDCTGPRNWTSEEIELITTVSEMLNTFLIKRNQINLLKKTEASLRDVLHHIDAWLCVINQSTYDVLFVNQKLSDSGYQQNASRSKCYQLLRDRETPCPDCYLHHMTSGTDYYSNEHYNQYENGWQKITLSKLSWHDCSDACLIQIDDITAQKKLQSL